MAFHLSRLAVRVFRRDAHNNALAPEHRHFAKSFGLGRRKRKLRPVLVAVVDLKVAVHIERDLEPILFGVKRLRLRELVSHKQGKEFLRIHMLSPRISDSVHPSH